MKEPLYTCQDKTAFPCILYQRLQVRLDGHLCAVHAVADMLRCVFRLTSKIFVFATQDEIREMALCESDGGACRATLHKALHNKDALHVFLFI